MDAFSSDDPFIDHLLELAFGVDTFALLDPSEMHILSAPSLFPTMHPSSLGAR
ncbi:hypothetical protein CAOG_007100 [Capsaspora owczarzaki ATCC 30864]|uniref:Uncharacterized protein n=1 Tax=Capsaspora owczarzaki (strain ATCC 30864) TaxID=595528 RepID=A0A0D2WWG0_CAPO3|nr:hypothetical protein CAOG_007100 [Capsaspora owczarzaki ATCC 30864]